MLEFKLLDFFVLQRDSSSFLAAVAANGGIASAGTAVLSESVIPMPRAVLTIPPPEPPVDYYENNISGGSDSRNSSNTQQKVSVIKKSVGNGTKVSSFLQLTFFCYG